VRSWGLSAAEQDEVWARWRQGESLRLIARRLGKRGPSVRAFVLQTGGVQQHPPRRALRCLSMAEREEISRGVAAGEPCRQIAARLGRAPSTVSRELARNGGRHHNRAQAADAGAFRRAQRPKPAKLVLQPRLRAVVEAKLALRWSPQQIAGWLPLAYPSDPVMRVSHETIYLSLFVQSRGALRRELQRYLRTGRAMRYPRAKRLPQGRGQLRDTLHRRCCIQSGHGALKQRPTYRIRSPWPVRRTRRSAAGSWVPRRPVRSDLAEGSGRTRTPRRSPWRRGLA
jgi:DNA-binding CsgD family transcriptional regulator